MATIVTDAARDVLTRARVEGNRVYLPEGQLPRPLYEEVDRALREAGGKWKGGKVRAHVFDTDAAPTLAGLLQAHRFVAAKETEQWFESPPDVARRLVEAALLVPGMEVLEPSAGRGAIARLLADLGCAVDCVEINPERAAIIQEAGYARKVIVGDFLAQPPVHDLYDAVVMNPPFAGHADEHHVLHALTMLRPGGVLVSLMGAGIRFRADRAAKRIRNLAGGAIDDVPAGAFKSVGAELATCIVVIRTGGTQLSGEPRRVSLHGPDPDLPVFAPATAPRGSYEAWDVGGQRWRQFVFYGDCAGCGGRTWNWIDEIGVSFGDHSYLPLTLADLPGWLWDQETRGGLDPEQLPGGVWEKEWPQCMGCRNDKARDDRAMRAVLASLKPPVDDHGEFTLF
jgi:predicted RNA methylase